MTEHIPRLRFGLRCSRIPRGATLTLRLGLPIRGFTPAVSLSRQRPRRATVRRSFGGDNPVLVARPYLPAIPLEFAFAFFNVSTVFVAFAESVSGRELDGEAVAHRSSFGT